MRCGRSPDFSEKLVAMYAFSSGVNAGIRAASRVFWLAT